MSEGRLKSRRSFTVSIRSLGRPAFAAETASAE